MVSNLYKQISVNECIQKDSPLVLEAFWVLFGVVLTRWQANSPRGDPSQINEAPFSRLKLSIGLYVDVEAEISIM